jgi:hypothetical protein
VKKRSVFDHSDEGTSPSALFDDPKNNPLIEIAKYATAHPDSRLRMLVAIYDMTNLINVLATSLIAEELLVDEEATDEQPSSPEQIPTELPTLPQAEA